MLFKVFLVFLFSFLCLLSDNVFFWWSVFLMMTVLFVMINKMSGGYSGLFNYFVIQESLGLLFLVFSVGFFQLFVVMMKIGVAPLHFWVFSVTNNIVSYALVWFLTFQKLPFFFVLVQLFYSNIFYFLFLGLFLCYLQIFSMKNYKSLVVLSSTESFNWILLGVLFSFINSFFLFIYYFFLLIFLLGKFNNLNLMFINWETSLVFLNIPFSVTFFVKIFSLSEVLKLDSFYSLFILFLMFLSVLSFSFWLINLSSKMNEDYNLNNKGFYFFLYPLMLVSLV